MAAQRDEFTRTGREPLRFRPPLAGPPLMIGRRGDERIPPELAPLLRRGFESYLRVLHACHERMSLVSKEHTQEFLRLMEHCDVDGERRLVALVLRYADRAHCRACRAPFLRVSWRLAHCCDECRRNSGAGRMAIPPRLDGRVCIRCAAPMGRGCSKYCGPWCAADAEKERKQARMAWPV